MKKLFLFIILANPLVAMEPVEMLHMQAPPVLRRIDTNKENEIMRERAHSISSDSELLHQIDELIDIFDRVTTIEDAQFINMVIRTVTKNQPITSEEIRMHMSDKLRSSTTIITELTTARDRSKLKKLMKGLLAESIEEAFARRQIELNELNQQHCCKIKRYQWALIASTTGGVLATLAAFLGAYFGH